MTDQKAHLHHYLRTGREVLVWKLHGVGEYDARRPLTPTGTNLLGLVKHLAGVEVGWLGLLFDRPFPDPLPWDVDTAEPNVDMWAQADESRADIVDLYRRACAHADVVRELVDGAAGHRADTTNMPQADQDWWTEYRRRGRAGGPSVRRARTLGRRSCPCGRRGSVPTRSARSSSKE